MKRISILLVSVLVISGLGVAESSAAIKTGAKCKKVGKVVVKANREFTCAKKGKKLTWSKGVPVAANPVTKPAESAAPSETPKASETPKPTESKSGYTLDQVKANDSATKCWSIIAGNVYDLTPWISSHPGGTAPIKSVCGKDGTSTFEGQHNNGAKYTQRIKAFLLGPLSK